MLAIGAQVEVVAASTLVPNTSAGALALAADDVRGGDGGRRGVVVGKRGRDARGVQGRIVSVLDRFEHFSMHLAYPLAR